MRETWTFSSAGTLIFGANAVQQLGAVADRIGAKRVLIVTDPIVAKAGLAGRVRGPLEESGVDVEVFDGGEPEPSIRAAERAIDAAKQFQAEAVLGLGGGSNMDLAKATAVILSHGGNLRDHLGDSRLTGRVWPLICVPTTAGTGSEVSCAAVLTDTDNHMKVAILSNYLRPLAAVVDPLLTLSCPPKVRADSGIDALTHAIEAFTAVDNADFPLPANERSVYQGRHPMGDCLAEKAIVLVGRNLRRAVLGGQDIEALTGMSMAATLAGLAFSNVGVALVHAMEYPLGGAVHVSHGCGNGLLLPWAMRFNQPARLVEFAAIARLLGEDTAGLDAQHAADCGVAAVDKLCRDIGIPARLRDLGVRREQLRGFTEKAFGLKRILRVNPRPVTVEEIERIYEAAY